MSDETSPEQLERVQRLAEAINQKKRLESDDQRSTDERLHADLEVQQALDDVRAHKEESEDPSAAEKCSEETQPAA